MRTTTLLALALPLLLGNLAAQEPTIVKVGDLIRLTAPAAGIDSLEGTITDFRGDTLAIQPANRRERYLFPLRSLTSVTILEAAPTYRVRVSTATQPSEPAWVVGALVSLTEDNLILGQDDGTQSSIARREITRLQVNRGLTSQVGRGALIGSGVGVILGWVMGEDNSFGPDKGESAAFVGLVGLLVGAGVGALNKTRRWEEVPLDRLVRSLRF